MEQASRRSILGILGVGTAAAVSTEALGAKDDMKYPMYCPAIVERGPDYQDSIATALENLARSIRKRDAIALKLTANSVSEGGEFLQHEVKIAVELPFEQSEVRVPKQIAQAEEMQQQARKVLDDAREEAKRIIEQAEAERLRAWEKAEERLAERQRQFASAAPPHG